MTRRYPLDALVTASGLTEAALGRAVGLSGTTLKRARVEGLLERSADRYAVRAGLHPFEVWPEMVEAIGWEKQERRRASWRRYAAKRRRERPEESRAADANYYVECSEYVKARERARYWANPEAARAARRERHIRRMAS